MTIIGRKWRFPDGVWRKCVIAETVLDNKMRAVGEIFTFMSDIDNTSIAMEMDEFINCEAMPLELEIGDITAVMNHGHILKVYVVYDKKGSTAYLHELDVATLSQKENVVMSIPASLELGDIGKVCVSLKDFPQKSEMYYVTPRAFVEIKIKYYHGELVKKVQDVIDALLSDDLLLNENGLKVDDIVNISSKVEQIKKQILSYHKNGQEA